MHKKHAKDGLVVISVTLDELSEEGSKERALAFLKEHCCTQLANMPVVWPPCAMVKMYNPLGMRPRAAARCLSG